MSSKLFIWMTIPLMFTMFYLSLRYGMQAVRRRVKLWSHDEQQHPEQHYRIRWLHSLSEHLAILIASVHSKMTTSQFMLGTCILALLGGWSGLLLFMTLKGILLSALMLGMLPYGWLRMKLVHMQMRAKLEFLPALEVFYQHYLLSEGKNMRNTIKLTLEADRIRYPIKPYFEQLYRNLTTGKGTEQSLQLFSTALGHFWAKYFANMLFVALTEGVDISVSLRELITDMRRAERASQSERNKLLEIRIANYSPIFFLATFIIVNFQLNYEQAYRYYVIDPAGRNMLLDALILIFASFLMGFHLSQRKI